MEVGQMLNDFWAQYGSIILSFLTSGVFGTIVIGVVRGIVSRFANKSRTAELTTEQLNAISQKIAEMLAGNVLDVDVSQVVTDATREELKEISQTVAALKTAVTNANESTALMAKGISRSKLLNEEEQQKLVTAADTLEATKTEKNRKRVKVKIESTEQTKPDDIVNFGG